MIETVGVVVPARNEEALLPACLAALGRAARQVSVPVRVLVAADSCTDRTAAVARAHGALVISLCARRVGAARAAGMAEVLRLTAGAGLDLAAIWLATTDADTVVPAGWLQRQVAHADQGWDVVLGTVTVADWSEHPPTRRPCSRPATSPGPPAPARARREPRDPGFGVPGRGRLPAAAFGRGSRADGGGGRGRVLGAAG